MPKHPELSVLLLLMFLNVIPARSYAILGAGDIVFDPGALQEQLIHYITMSKQYATQMQQYAAQIQHLQNSNMNLQNLNFQADLSALNGMKQVMNSATGMSNDFTAMQAQFEKLYPDFKTYETQNGTSYSQQSAEWSRQNQQNANDILRTETKLQEAISQDQNTIRSLSNRSDTASGTKDLLQVMNQLLIMQTKQLMQLEQLLSSTAKANSAYMAERASKEAAAAARSQNMNRNWIIKGARTVNPELDHLH